MRGGETISGKLRRVAAAGATVLVLSFSPVVSALGETAVGELLPVGQNAPDFESVDINDQPFTLQQALVRGPVFLVFWSIFCSICQEELPVINKEQAEYADRKVQFITVNLDEPKRAKVIKGFVKQQGFTFQVVWNKTEERDFKIDKLYQVTGTPASYLVEPKGNILFAKYGAITPEEMHHAIEQLPSN